MTIIFYWKRSVNLDMMEKMKEGNKDMKKMGSMHNMKGMDKKAKK